MNELNVDILALGWSDFRTAWCIDNDQLAQFVRGKYSMNVCHWFCFLMIFKHAPERIVQCIQIIKSIPVDPKCQHYRQSIVW